MLVRKTITALFCDVDESVALGERLDPEALRRLMARYFDTVAPVLERHGGSVEKFIGDAIVAVFGIPTAHEDDALRAVRAAAEIRERVEELNDELERDFGVRLALQIGVNTGEAVVGDPASGRTLATGDVMNVAARLQQAAAPDEILLGKATYPLVRHAVKAARLEAFSLKGKTAPIAPWRLDEVVPTEEAVARRFDRPLVGRERELDRLVAECERAAEENACRLVTILGEPGIGKSRLGRALADSLAVRANTLTGRCLPYGDGVTFWPLAQIVRELGGEEAVLAALGEADDAGVVAERVLAATGLREGAAGSEETFWAVRRLFEAVARSRPLVLLLEDVHWAEPMFLDLVEYLAGWTRDAPLLLVCLARPELLEHQPGWPRDGLMTLLPLSEAESRRLLLRLGAETGLAGVSLSRIRDAAEGNPLFIEQMVALIAEEGMEGAPLPPSIHALLTARLDRLPAAERAVLERASVVGREFWRSAVVELSPPEERGEVGRRLLALTRRELVRPERSLFLPEEDAFRFAHALVRDAAYEGMPKEARADLHERFAAWLDRHAAERAVEIEEIVGYHLERAYEYREQLGPVDADAKRLAERGGELLASAARRAFARDDTPAAVALFERAIALLGDDADDRAALLTDLGSALMKAGEFGRAEEVLTDAVGLAQRTRARQVELRALVERQIRRSFAAPEGAAREDQRVAEAAIPELEALGDDLGLAKAWRLLSDAHAFACRWEARANALEKALLHARRAPEARQDATALVALLAQALHYGPAAAPKAIARCRQLLSDAGSDPGVRAGVGPPLAALLAQRGQFAEARALYAESVAHYEELGLRHRRAVRVLVGGEIELLAGDVAAAERELRLGYEMLEGMGERHARPVVAGFLADVLCTAGGVEEAERLALVAAELAATDDVAAQALQRAVRARVLVRRGDLDEAATLAAEAVDRASGTDFLTLRASTLAALAEVRGAAGDAHDAARLLREARCVHEEKGNVVAARSVGDAIARLRARFGDGARAL